MSVFAFLNINLTEIYFPSAIATTNAVIAGLIVFEAFKILEDKWTECRHVITYPPSFNYAVDLKKYFPF